MTRRLATIYLMMVSLTGMILLPVRAQSAELEDSTLKGISSLFVTVESLPDGAKVLGLTADAIQTEVELKLRLAGIGVVTRQEGLKLPGMPELYVRVTLTEHAAAASIEIQLQQNARLDRNGELAFGVVTWDTIGLLSSPDSRFIRDNIKDLVDTFLNAWLSVNPKK
jgi:hypothetical protein